MAQENTNVPVIGVSRENYDILNRIAADYDVTIKEVADGLLQKGLKFSSFRLYATKGSVEAQKTYATMTSTDKLAVV